jgi:hypothetical protein
MLEEYWLSQNSNLSRSAVDENREKVQGSLILSATELDYSTSVLTYPFVPRGMGIMKRGLEKG